MSLLRQWQPDLVRGNGGEVRASPFSGIISFPFALRHRVQQDPKFSFSGGRAMTSGWYYMASGWIRKSRRVGPISDADLLHQIEKGKISPETLLQSSKTKGKWVPMNTIAPAMQRWRELHPEEEEGISSD